MAWPPVSTGPVDGVRLAWSEMHCYQRMTDRHGHPIAWTDPESGRIHRPGALVAAYPLDWRDWRAVAVGQAFGLVRDLHGLAVYPTSFFRTPSYNAAVGGASGSLHVEGLAWDAPPPAGVDVRDWALEIVALARTPAGAMIRGVGYSDRRNGAASDFVHVDCRQARTVVLWQYTRAGIVAWAVA